MPSATERGSGTTVLVAGSVGTGKTTLLADWAAELEGRGDLVGWASLDREDNDPQVMAETLLGAVRTGGLPDVPRLADETVPSVLGPAYVTWLLELAGTVRRNLWLVLDDLHLVRDPRCLDLVELLVRWAPSHLHVVVGTRSEPGLHLARLRLEERLVEVREHDLRFRLDDTRELLARHDLALEDEQVRHLQELTEGWAAGVALAAVSLARGRDADAFLREFARSDRAMSGYLVEEVLASLDESTREFLLSTSVLEDLTADLAAAVTGRDDAGALLDALSSDNAMVTVDRVGTPTYRYHVLLRSYLGAMLEAGSVRGAREVHARAAQWYAAHDVPGRALRHAEAAGDLDLMSDVIHQHALHLLLDGRASDVEAAVRTVRAGDPVMTAVAALASLDLADPEAARRQLSSLETRPGTWFTELSEDEDEAEDPAVLPLERLLAVGLRWLSFVGRDPGRQPAGDDTVAGTAAGGAERLAAGLAAELSSTMTAWSAGPATRGAASGRPLADGHDDDPLAADEPPDHGLSAGRVPHAQADLTLLDALTSGDVLLGSGRFAEAQAAYRSALGTARGAGHPLPALQAMVGLASAAAGLEDLVGLATWSERALAEAQGTPWATSPRLLPAHVLAGWAAFNVLDDTAARSRNRTALELLGTVASTVLRLAEGQDVPDGAAGAPGGVPSTAARGLEQLARLARLLDANLDLLEAGAQPGTRQDVADRVMAGAREVAHLTMTPLLAAGELARAHRVVLLAGFPRLAQEVEGLTEGLPGAGPEVATMAAVRHLRGGDDAAARAAVVPVLAAVRSARPAGRTAVGAAVPGVAVQPVGTLGLRVVVTAHLVAAVVAHRNVQPTVAHEELVAALTLAAPQRALRMVLEVAPEVVDVLAAGVGRFGELEPFVLELREHAGTFREGAVEPLLDVALSARELSLLRELPSLLTVAEIAEARAVSRNTVKTQLRSLFQKLGVGSRRDAVAAARRLGLL
ncbi:LuxR C-terminal-related transcriptional regulator [Terrabacter carboxydivorans]|uniref:LuxR C-terminal-related transcriptional regulator n=1 Tax=Terrabacter carboxydivorans TaxID=619730 RepID=UPI0031E121F6